MVQEQGGNFPQVQTQYSRTVDGESSMCVDGGVVLHVSIKPREALVVVSMRETTLLGGIRIAAEDLMSMMDEDCFHPYSLVLDKTENPRIAVKGKGKGGGEGHRNAGRGKDNKGMEAKGGKSKDMNYKGKGGAAQEGYSMMGSMGMAGMGDGRQTQVAHGMLGGMGSAGGMGGMIGPQQPAVAQGMMGGVGGKGGPQTVAHGGLGGACGMGGLVPNVAMGSMGVSQPQSGPAHGSWMGGVGGAGLLQNSFLQNNMPAQTFLGCAQGGSSAVFGAHAPQGSPFAGNFAS
eukprot:1900438-Alexandrium_andersonii.AAC.1